MSNIYIVALLVNSESYGIFYLMFYHPGSKSQDKH